MWAPWLKSEAGLTESTELVAILFYVYVVIVDLSWTILEASCLIGEHNAWCTITESKSILSLHADFSAHDRRLCLSFHVHPLHNLEVVVQIVVKIVNMWVELV